MQNFIGPDDSVNLAGAFVGVIMLGFGFAFATYAGAYFSTVFRKFVDMWK